MLWSAAVCLSSRGHGQALVAAAPDVDPLLTVTALILFLGALALVRASWTSRRGTRG
jgi:hypothetical protein